MADTLIDRRAAREALQAEYVERAREKAVLAGLTISCQGPHRPFREHPTCAGAGARTGSPLGCLCDCHDADKDD